MLSVDQRLYVELLNSKTHKRFVQSHCGPPRESSCWLCMLNVVPWSLIPLEEGGIKVLSRVK